MDLWGGGGSSREWESTELSGQLDDPIFRDPDTLKTKSDGQGSDSDSGQ